MKTRLLAIAAPAPHSLPKQRSTKFQRRKRRTINDGIENVSDKRPQ